MTETQLNDFVDYTMSFYGPNGIYPMGATLSLIQQATDDLIRILQIKNEEFCGDSIDRELVRDLLISKYNLKFPRK
jgi:hypothetical protein